MRRATAIDVAAFYLYLGLGMKKKRWCGERREEKDIKNRMEGRYSARVLAQEKKRVNT